MRVRGLLVGVAVLVVAGCSSTAPAAVSSSAAVVSSSVSSSSSAAVSSAPATPTTFTLTGTMRLSSGATTDIPVGSGCHGFGGYQDISDGTAVTVYDAAGTVVAAGALGGSKFYGVDSGSSEITGACTFVVRVPDVPVGSKFYQVEVSHRGKLTVPADEAQGGQLAVTLGS